MAGGQCQKIGYKNDMEVSPCGSRIVRQTLISVNTFHTSGNYYIYLTDCNSKILSVSDPILFNFFGSAIFSVGGIPECSPFKLFASELYRNTVFTGGIADQVGLLEFDPRILDSDCPGPLSTTSIPTLSQWGIIGLATTMLIFGVVGIRQRKLIFG